MFYGNHITRKCFFYDNDITRKCFYDNDRTSLCETTEKNHISLFPDHYSVHHTALQWKKAVTSYLDSKCLTPCLMFRHVLKLIINDKPLKSAQNEGTQYF